MAIPLRERMRGVLADLGGDALIAAAPPVPVREIFRRFWPDARPYRRWLWPTLLLVALAPALDSATIWLYKLLIDSVLVPRDFGPFGPLALAYLGLTLLRGLVSFGEDYLSAWVGEHFLLDLRTRFFRHLQSLSLDFFAGRQLGDVLARLTGDIAAIESLVLTGVADALSYGLKLVIFIGLLFHLNATLALISLTVVPLFWIVARVFSRRIKRASREKRRRSGSISAVAEEQLANAALVQAYNRQDRAVARFHREGAGALVAQLAATRLKAIFAPLVDLIELGGTLIVVAVGTWALAHEQLTLGGLLVFLAYLSQLYSPLRRLSSLTTTVQAASASAERIIEFLDERPAVAERPGASDNHRSRGAITVEGVAFRYAGASRDALADISLRVEPGQTLALVGVSGAGKSTLARLLLRFHDPAAGRILLDGVDLRDLSLRALRENVAVLFQESLLFDGTIRENIAFGRPGATEEEVVAAARAADAHDFVVALPDGYDTVVGQGGRRLSGGQRQRVAIARAMIRNAPVLVLDEPTTGLDAASAARVLVPLRRLMAGRTTIIITHDLATVREDTAIVVLQAGKIIERGAHEDLLRRAGIYAALYRQRHATNRPVPAEGQPGASPPETGAEAVVPGLRPVGPATLIPFPIVPREPDDATSAAPVALAARPRIERALLLGGVALLLLCATLAGYAQTRGDGPTASLPGFRPSRSATRPVASAVATSESTPMPGVVAWEPLVVEIQPTATLAPTSTPTATLAPTPTPITTAAPALGVPSTTPTPAATTPAAVAIAPTPGAAPTATATTAADPTIAPPAPAATSTPTHAPPATSAPSVPTPIPPATQPPTPVPARPTATAIPIEPTSPPAPTATPIPPVVQAASGPSPTPTTPPTTNSSGPGSNSGKGSGTTPTPTPNSGGKGSAPTATPTSNGGKGTAATATPPPSGAGGTGGSGSGSGSSGGGTSGSGSGSSGSGTSGSSGSGGKGGGDDGGGSSSGGSGSGKGGGGKP